MPLTLIGFSSQEEKLTFTCGCVQFLYFTCHWFMSVWKCLLFDTEEHRYGNYVGVHVFDCTAWGTPRYYVVPFMSIILFSLFLLLFFMSNRCAFKRVVYVWYQDVYRNCTTLYMEVYYFLYFNYWFFMSKGCVFKGLFMCGTKMLIEIVPRCISQ